MKPDRPILVISKCLGCAECRYDGTGVKGTRAESLHQVTRIVPVCPEEEIGLGTPRPPIRVVEGEAPCLYQPETGRDLTDRMIRFTETFLDRLDEVDGFLLKSRSPSCGVRDAKVYVDEDSEELSDRRGPGLFARGVLQRHPLLPIEDERRLRDAAIWERFVTRLFAAAALRHATRQTDLKDLREFHEKVRSFIEDCSRAALERIEGIVENREQRPPIEVVKNYRDEYLRALRRLPAKEPRFPGRPPIEVLE